MKQRISVEDFIDDEGLMLVGLSNAMIPVVHALSVKTGQDMSYIISVAIQKLATEVLSDEEKRQLALAMEKSKSSL